MGQWSRETLHPPWRAVAISPAAARHMLQGREFFFSSQVLHFENVKDVPFGFQTVTSDVNKLSSFYSLKLIKRLYVDKSLNPSTVSGSMPLTRFNFSPELALLQGQTLSSFLSPVKLTSRMLT